MVVYKLTHRGENWVELDRDWCSQVSGRLWCRGCKHIRRELYPRPIDAKLSMFRPGMTIESERVGIIHRRLLDCLREHLAGFAFGTVYCETGVKLEEYCTFYSAHFVQPRGSVDPYVSQCITCGAISYSCKDDPHVLKHQLGSGHVYQDATGNTYVDDWLASQIDWKAFRDVKLCQFSVRDHPADGWRLPGDPDWLAMGIPSQEWKSRVLNIPSLKNEDMGPWPPDGDNHGQSVQNLIPPPMPEWPPMVLKYFAGPTTDMAGFAGESKTCLLCGRQGSCFELEYAICQELPQGAREGKIGCYDCLRGGRLEFWHGTERGLLHEHGLRSERTEKLYLPKGFSEASLVELRRTPRIATNQEERWLTHCNDFMAYQGVWSPPDFYEHAPDGDGRALFMAMTDPDGQKLWDNSWSDKSQPLEYWYGTYYVFKCLHCGKLRGNWDVD